MQKRSLLAVPALALLAMVVSMAVQSCKKTSTLNTNDVIKTPYVLYFSDMQGALHVTNDGVSHKVVFPADGKPCRAICVSGPNIIMVKNRLYYSSNNGVNFNIGYDSVRKDYVMDSSTCFRYVRAQNQSMILDMPDNNSIYVAADCSSLINPPYGSAIAFNLNGHGARGVWGIRLLDTTGNNVGNRPDSINSMTRLKNGTVIGYCYGSTRFYYDIKPYFEVGWKESTGNSAGIPGLGDPTRQAGTGLPSSDTFTIGHINNRLIAGSVMCSGAVLYSDDSGRNWSAYNTIAKAPVLCIASPFEQVCLIGTEGQGLWILNQHTNVWQQAKNGLPANLTVRAAVGKKATFRNDAEQQYIYIATDQGIYQSKDGGINWTLTIKGDFGRLY